MTSEHKEARAEQQIEETPTITQPSERRSVIGKVCKVFVEAIHDGSGRIVGTIMDEQERALAQEEGQSIQQAALKQFFNL